MRIQLCAAFFSTAEELRREQADEQSDAKPGKPIACSHVKRFLPGHAYFSGDRYEAIGHGRRFRQDAAAVVAESQEPVARRTSKREPVFDRAQDRHARVQPAIDVEIPRGHQQEVRAFGCVFAAELGEIHVLANLQSPTSGRFIENDAFVARFFGFDTREKMMLVIVCI